MQQLGNSNFPFPSLLQYFSFMLNFFNFFKAFSLAGGCLFLLASAWFLSKIDIICEKKSPSIFDLKFEEKLSDPCRKDGYHSIYNKTGNTVDDYLWDYQIAAIFHY